MTRDELEALVDAALDRSGVAVPRAVLKRELIPALQAVQREATASALAAVRSRLRRHLGMKESSEIPALMARLRKDLAA